MSDRKGIIGRYYENDLPVILSFLNEWPDKAVRTKFPLLVVIAWEYEGSAHNGMPPREINDQLIALENALEEHFAQGNLSRHAYNRTGNNLKEFVYYCGSQEIFLAELNQALKEHNPYPIDITFYPDKDWTEFQRLLEDFKL